MHAAVHDNLVAVGTREEVASCSMQFWMAFHKTTTHKASSFSKTTSRFNKQLNNERP